MSSPLPRDNVGDSQDATQPPVLEIEGLTIQFEAERYPHPMPVQGISFTVPRGTRVALVGESGSSKSLTAAAVLGMLPAGATIVRGSIRLNGEELIGVGERRLRELRGRRMAIMFQNPRASLNPVLTVGGQIAELIRVHEHVGRSESRERAIDILDQMGISDARRRSKDYPHQYSGGMAQRAVLAMALSCRPDLLIADEPTTGLDATLQQQVLELMVEKVAERNSSLLLITHDIGIVGTTTDEMVVLYAGRVMEAGPTAAILSNPTNPYTSALLDAYHTVERGRMGSIPGTVPTLMGPIERCVFEPRCPLAGAECRDGAPELRVIRDRRVACVKA